jgi:hypothetical protein
MLVTLNRIKKCVKKTKYADKETTLDLAGIIFSLIFYFEFA